MKRIWWLVPAPVRGLISKVRYRGVIRRREKSARRKFCSAKPELAVGAMLTDCPPEPPGTGTWFQRLLLNPETIASLAVCSETHKAVIATLSQLKRDDFDQYTLAYCAAGLERYGTHWQYMDLLSILYAAGTLLKPLNYLEIGVRRGRSMAVVASVCPTVNCVGFDLWLENYAAMENPGPEFVKGVLETVGHTGQAQLVEGNSHEKLPAFFAEHPDTFFDIICVDGDHTEMGAYMDLLDVIPHLCRGG